MLKINEVLIPACEINSTISIKTWSFKNLFGKLFYVFNFSVSSELLLRFYKSLIRTAKWTLKITLVRKADFKLLA